jgi:hypothetical protein
MNMNDLHWYYISHSPLFWTSMASYILVISVIIILCVKYQK